MKTLATTLLIASTLTIGTIASPAADKDTQRPQRGDKQGKGGGGRDALFAVLDADGDGALSAQELQNAAAALAKLDKNGDGNLTQEELTATRGGKGGKGGKGDKARRGGNKEGKGNKGDKQRKNKPQN